MAHCLARQVRVHHGTVRRVLTQAGIPAADQSTRRSMSDPFVPFIQETLARYPTLRASRLYQMVRERGYPGRPDHFRAIVARQRPRPAAEAYLRLRTLPAEQGQVDWAHFGKLAVGKALRPLMAFVMVLSYSRHLFLRFYLSAAMSSFLDGHVRAFTFFNGVPRTLLYDNLRSAVLERVHLELPRMRSASIPHCWSSRPGIASHRARWPSRAATRRAGSSGRSASCASASSPRGALPISRI